MTPQKTDKRPLAATGHLSLRVADALSAARRLVAIGIREVVAHERFAVLELRGGTHIVVQQVATTAVHSAPFDLMFDDLDAAHARFKAEGFEVSGIGRGGVHRGFLATAPEGFRLQVIDSHVGDRVV